MTNKDEEPVLARTSVRSSGSGSTTDELLDRHSARISVKRILEDMDAAKTQDFYKDHGWAQHIARSPSFEHITLVIISLNSLWIAVEVDHNDKDNLWQAHWVFIAVENFLCLFYLVEFVARFAAFESKVNAYKDRWLVFDCGLLIFMVFETWVSALLYVAFGLDAIDLGPLGILRLARLCRVARLVRLARACPEIMIIMRGMLAAMRSAIFTMLFLLGVVYVFAILFRQLCIDTALAAEYHYFDSVMNSIVTLVCYGLYMDSIVEIVERLREESVGHLLVFVAFMLICSHTVLNFLIGMMCEVVTTVTANEKLELLVNFLKDELNSVMARYPRIDRDAITKENFLKICTDESAVNLFNKVNVDSLALVETVDGIFLGEKASYDGTIDFNTLLDIIVSVRGSNICTVQDLSQLRHFLLLNFDKLVTRLDTANVVVQHGNDKQCDSSDTRTERGCCNEMHGDSHIGEPPFFPADAFTSELASLSVHEPSSLLEAEREVRRLKEFNTSNICDGFEAVACTQVGTAVASPHGKHDASRGIPQAPPAFNDAFVNGVKTGVDGRECLKSGHHVHTELGAQTPERQCMPDKLVETCSPKASRSDSHGSTNPRANYEHCLAGALTSAPAGCEDLAQNRQRTAMHSGNPAQWQSL